MPFPQLAVLLASLHVRSSTSGASWLKVRCCETALGQSDDRVQTHWVWRHRAADPRQRGRLRAGVELEHLDRFPVAMMDDIQGMEGVPARTKKEAVRSELVLFFGIDRPRARIVGLGVEALFEVRAWVQRGRGLVSDVYQRDCSRSRISRGNHPV